MGWRIGGTKCKAFQLLTRMLLVADMPETEWSSMPFYHDLRLDWRIPLYIKTVYLLILIWWYMLVIHELKCDWKCDPKWPLGVDTRCNIPAVDMAPKWACLSSGRCIRSPCWLSSAPVPVCAMTKEARNSFKFTRMCKCLEDVEDCWSTQGL